MIRARGAARDAAAMPIVVARKPLSQKAIRRARSTVVCDDSVAELGVPEAIAAAGLPGAAGGSGGVLGKVAGKVKEPLGWSAAGAMAETARRVVDRATFASDSLLHNRLVVTVIAVIVMISAALGGLALAQLARTVRYRGYH